MIQGILFDMDGVLFDTETLCGMVEQRTIRELGYTPPPVLRSQLCGKAQVLIKDILLDTFGPEFPYDEYLRRYYAGVQQQMAQNGIPEKPHLRETLHALAGLGLPMAVASSATRAEVQSNLDTVGIAGFFSAIVGGDMVAHSKPAPDIYLSAAQALGLPPAECLAVEDSHAGVRSAAAAGCTVVMIPDYLPANEEMRGLAAAILPDLSALPALVRSLVEK